MGSVKNGWDDEKLERLPVDGLSAGVKNHIKKNHIFPAKQGKSYFLHSEETVWRLIQKTCNSPEIITQHNVDEKRYVLKKKFNVPVGIHGKTGVLCLFVTVIYDIQEQRIVTAFPTM